MKINKTKPSSAFILPKQRERVSAFTLIELLVVIAIIAILASIALPVFSTVQERGKQTKDMSNAKQIATACKVFAGDHDGKFPYQDGRTDPPTDLTFATAGASTSNNVFASLIPDYLGQEKIFYLGGSAWSPTVPDENTAAAAARVETSTNNFAYMFGLSDTDNPSYPLVFDAPAAAATTYPVSPGQKGGVWHGKKAVVVHSDVSASLEKVDPASSTILGATGGAVLADILIPAAPWMDATANLVMYPDTP
jgi:prepilin-type N-terminal cleavage/methylation domain-containing protein